MKVDVCKCLIPNKWHGFHLSKLHCLGDMYYPFPQIYICLFSNILHGKPSGTLLWNNLLCSPPTRRGRQSFRERFFWSIEDVLVEVNNFSIVLEMPKKSNEMYVTQNYWTNLFMDSQDFGCWIWIFLLHQRIFLNFDSFWQK